MFLKGSLSVVLLYEIKARKIGCYFIVIKIKEKKKVSVQEQCLLLLRYDIRFGIEPGIYKTIIAAVSNNFMIV